MVLSIDMLTKEDFCLLKNQLLSIVTQIIFWAFSLKGLGHEKKLRGRYFHNLQTYM